MDKLTTGVAYGTSAGNAGFWALQLLDKVTPSQWAAIGAGQPGFWPADVSDKSLFQD